MRSLLIALAASCSFATSLFAADPSEYAQLVEGQEWTMDGEIVFPDGKKSEVTGRRKVEGPVEHNGKSYLRTRTWIEGGPKLPPVIMLSRKDATGYYSVKADVKDAREETQFLLPLKVGQTWRQISGEYTLTHTVVALESLTIGDKKYEDCFHIRSVSDNGDFTENYWEAPKLGSIKSEMTYGNGVKIILTLREFKPGKAAETKDEPAKSGK